jgi:hypothetical protein
MEFRGITERAREIRLLYEAIERDAYGRSWSLGELALGLVGDGARRRNRSRPEAGSCRPGGQMRPSGSLR